MYLQHDKEDRVICSGLRLGKFRRVVLPSLTRCELIRQSIGEISLSFGTSFHHLYFPTIKIGAVDMPTTLTLRESATNEYEHRACHASPCGLGAKYQNAIQMLHSHVFVPLIPYRCEYRSILCLQASFHTQLASSMRLIVYV